MNFNAVITQSTESRFSPGRVYSGFTSDVDDYIDPAFFNPEIGTFLFLGGTAGVAAAVQTPSPYAISVGFGKTLGAGYLGLYYAGSLVSASGSKTDNADPAKDTAVSKAAWLNNLAVLFGIGGMGFRLDFILENTTVDTDTVDGKVSEQTTTDAPSLALSWGANLGGTIPLWATVGFKFPDTTVTTDFDPGNPGKAPSKKMTEAEGSALGVTVGGSIETGETTSILAELYVRALFADSVSGDKGLIGQDPYTSGGAFGAGLYAHFQKAVTFGEATVKITPNLILGFISESNNSSIKNSPKLPSYNWFTLTPGLDVSIEYKHDKVALYTGFGLSFFSWSTLGFAGGDDANKTTASEWAINGITWLTTGNLGFGITFAPIEGLVFGTGITLGVNINPSAMTISTTRTGDWAIPNTALAITASYRY